MGWSFDWKLFLLIVGSHGNTVILRLKLIKEGLIIVVCEREMLLYKVQYTVDKI